MAIRSDGLRLRGRGAVVFLAGVVLGCGVAMGADGGGARPVEGGATTLPVNAGGAATRAVGTTQSATTQMATTQPAATQTAATQPATTQTAASRPATTTAVVPVVVPSPKAVALGLAAAIDKGDLAEAKGLMVVDEGNVRWVEATIGLANALKKLDTVAVGKFGEAGKAVSQNRLHLVEGFKGLEQAQEKIEGDVARVIGAGQNLEMGLVKAGGFWRIGSVGTGVKLAEQVGLYEALTRAAEETSAEIADGRLKSVEEARRVFGGRVFAARVRG